MDRVSISAKLRDCCPPSFALGLMLLLSPCSAQAPASSPLRPVQVYIGGQLVQSPIACCRDEKNVFIPLQAIGATGARWRLESSGEAVRLKPAGSEQWRELAVATPDGKPMVVLSDLARLLDADVELAPRAASGAQPTPVTLVDRVYLLARLKRVRVDDGDLKVETSFPVPYRVRMITDGTIRRAYMDLCGAEVEDSFAPDPVPGTETRVTRLRAGQFNLDTARVVAELAPRAWLKEQDVAATADGRAAAALLGPQVQLADSLASPPAAGRPPGRAVQQAGSPGGTAGQTAETSSGARGQLPFRAATQRPRRPDVAAPAPGNSVGGTQSQGPMNGSGNETPPAHSSTLVLQLPGPGTAVGPRPASDALNVEGVDVSPDSDTEVHVHVRTSSTPHIRIHYLNGGDLGVLIRGAKVDLKDPSQAQCKLNHPLLQGYSIDPAPDGSGVEVTLHTSRFVGFGYDLGPTGLTLDLRQPRNATGVLADKLIVIDPGHGGSSTGATCAGCDEKNFTLAISLKLRKAFEAAGVRVVMTRDRDVDVALDSRPELANSLHADFFVSIHNDSNGVLNSASGTSTWFHMQDPSSRALAECVQQAIVRVSGIPSRGVMSDRTMYQHGFAVLRLSKMPAILVEVAFINDSHDRRCLCNSEFQEAVAKAIVAGFRRYVEGSPQTAMLVP